MEWYRFDPRKGDRQRLPKGKHCVLLQLWPGIELEASVVVGFLDYHGGVKSEPFFVVPGMEAAKVHSWCDCLGKGFSTPPLWVKAYDDAIDTVVMLLRFMVMAYRDPRIVEDAEVVEMLDYYRKRLPDEMWKKADETTDKTTVERGICVHKFMLEFIQLMKIEYERDRRHLEVLENEVHWVDGVGLD